MSVIIVLICASLLIAVGFLIAFIWAVTHGQFDDNVTPAMRILFDKPSVKNNSKETDNAR